MAEQVWFVTGASRGLGRSVVEEALAAGHRVAGTARRVDALAEFGRTYPGRFLALPLDVTDSARAHSAVGETVSTFGRLDVVVNNAGYANIAPIEDVDLDDFRSQVDAVFLGTVYVTKAALPVFRAQNSGHFIQVTSIGGRLTSRASAPTRPPSSPSKASPVCLPRRSPAWGSRSPWLSPAPCAPTGPAPPCTSHSAHPTTRPPSAR